MTWTKDNGKFAIDAAEQAIEAAEYFDEKKPLIDKFTDEQTNLQAQINQLVVEGDSSPEAAQARVGVDDTTYSTLKARLDAEHEQVTQQLAQSADDIVDRGFNLRNLNLPLDGSMAIQNEVMQALATYKHVVVPPGAIIGISDTLRITQGQSLIGLADNVRGLGTTATIKWIGSKENRKSAVLIGRNLVGAEPTLDASDIVFKNFMIDCDYKAGFGVYGTYLTNETNVDNVYVKKALEYGFFFAKGWYTKITRIIAMDCKNIGISLGMPLEYLDGTSISWATSASLELNNCKLHDFRAMRCGQHFSIDNPNTFTPHDTTKRRKGFGIGFGIGNSFNVDTFTSEQSGGVGIYVYNGAQPIKNISTGYLEGNCLNSGLDSATEMTNILIENTSSGFSDAVVLSDIFCNFNAGGIYHTGTHRLVWLKNVHQPRFLKSLDGLSPMELYSVVLKDNVYQCGLYNSLEQVAAGVNIVQTVNTRSNFTVPVGEYHGFKLIYVKSADGTLPQGSIVLNNNDGTTTSRSYPALSTTDYTLVVVGTTRLTSITRGGAAGTSDSNIIIKVVNTPLTNV